MPAAHHVGLTVADLDRMVAFYRDVLGFAVVDRFEVGGAAFARGVDVPDASARFAHLDADGVRLELVAYDPPGESQAPAGLNEAGATHLGLATPDVDALYEELPSKIETLSPPQTTESGTRICFLRDPEGNLVELLET
jgi:catechol 2,3-dioxygenase-like lactoylglutathione lyase family enzyme